MPAEKAVRIEFENRSRSRSRWAFEIAASDGSVEEVILGDPADRDVPDKERTKLRSSPKITLTADQLSRMVPASRKTLDTLVAKGEVERRELSA